MEKSINNNYFFYFDQNRCTGCKACIVACKDWNQVNPGPVSWRKIVSAEDDGSNECDFKVLNVTYGCLHCAEPECVKACASGAIKKDSETGAVIIDRELCSGLELCVSACPYNAIYIADDEQEPEKQAEWQVRHPAQKCTMCWDRLAVGKKPACVDCCPQRALDFGTASYLEEKYGSSVLLERELKDVFKCEPTSPSILFKKKR